ncbi:MAG: hypothetical protein ACREP6_09895, partial [Candidatus Binataceae bacterium]
MATSLKTSRGIYLVEPATAPETADDFLSFAMAVQRADGIERIALRFVIATALLSALEEQASADGLTARIGPWLEAQFEQVR